MSASTTLTTLASIPGLKKVASGKVREIFELDDHSLLFVATDRVSAYDVILSNGIPEKGALLTQLSKYWFDLISSNLPDVRTHLISTSVPASIPSDTGAVLEKRSMMVRRLPLVPLESIVRGYITGSAWAEYQRSGTVHGISMPAGLRESQKLEKPIWTPSTKAEQGEHDENISRDKAVEIVGESVAKRVEEASLVIYEKVGPYSTDVGVDDTDLISQGQAVRRRAWHHHRRHQIRVRP